MSIDKIIEKIRDEIEWHVGRKKIAELTFNVHVKCGGICNTSKTIRESLSD